MIQEWWGLNDQICGVADRFARAGYSALAPDLYQGRVTHNADEASHLLTGLDFPGATHQDIRGAVRRLAAGGAKVAVMGFCMVTAFDIAERGLTKAAAFAGERGVRVEFRPAPGRRSAAGGLRRPPARTPPQCLWQTR